MIPNALTATNLTFGSASCFFSVSGNIYLAGWFVLLAVCFDRVDGAAARALGATSRFGVEFDSLADLVSFGIAPAVLVFSALTLEVPLGYATAGWQRTLLFGCCAFYVAACAFRLARFNVFAGSTGTKIYFGMPSPASAATVVTATLVLLKYSRRDNVYPSWAADIDLLGSLQLGSAVRTWFPLLPVLIGVLMVSSLKVPKMIPSKSRRGIYLGINMGLVYLFVLLRILPEYLFFLALQVIVVSFIYHFFWAEARELSAGSVWDALTVPADPPENANPASGDGPH